MGCMINQGNLTAPWVDMTGKNILITGPSIGGIGFETAIGLAVRYSSISSSVPVECFIILLWVLDAH